MSTAGNERGLSLRSPGRFCAAADRLVELWPRHAGSALAGTARGDRVVDAWIKAQAYRLYTWGTVTRLAAGGDMGAAGSVNKVFWSELDVALHETALDLLGPEAEVESAWTGRLPVLALRPDLRRHQRDPAQRRRRAHPRPAPRAQGSGPMKFELTAEQSDFAQSLDQLLTGADTVAAARAWAAGDHDPGLALWRRLAEQGVTALLVPDSEGGMGATPVELASPSRRSVATPSGPWIESAACLPLGHGRAGHGRRASAHAVRPGRRRRRPSTPVEDGAPGRAVGELVALDRPDPRLFEVTPGEAAEVDDPRARSTSPPSRPPPSCWAAVNGCWPTRWPT